jgi:hypothetical protein
VADPRPGRKKNKEVGPDRIRVPAFHDRRPLPRRLFRNPRRRKGDRGSILVQSKCLLRVARDHRETGPIG